MTVVCADAKSFIVDLENKSVTLAIIDPPYFQIVNSGWDNKWETEEDYLNWIVYDICFPMFDKLADNGSLILFGGIGKHKSHPFFKTIIKLEDKYTFRNMITWAKRKAYGKSHDYLFCREEIAWFSKSSERTEVVFNIPLTNEKRGYDGWNKKYKAKSEYKRVSNVWKDIPELMKTKRIAQKPEPLLERIILTHSNPGDLIADPMVGFGTTAIAAKNLGRKFLCADIDEQEVEKIKERLGPDVV